MIPTVIEQQRFPACVHLSIEFNQHAVYYQTAEEWLTDQRDGTSGCWFQWVSAEEREQAIRADSIWTCQWYPITPIGFRALAASTYEALMKAVNGGPTS